METPSPIHIDADLCTLDAAGLDPRDRRILLGSALGILLRRFGNDAPIFVKDLLRIAALADDAFLPGRQ